MSETKIKTPVRADARLAALDPGLRERPHDYLDDLRSRDPVHADPDYDRVILTCAADVSAVLNDRSLATDPYKSRPGSFSRLLFGDDPRFKPSILHMDDPDHKRLRSLVTRAFNPASMEALRPQVVALATKLIDEIGERPAFDVIGDFGRNLALYTIANMIGIEEADWDNLRQWSDDTQIIFNPLRTEAELEQMFFARGSLTKLLFQQLERRRANRTNDLMSGLIAAEEDGDRLTTEEIISTLQVILVAGNVTTQDLIGSGVMLLLQNPDQLAKLRENPELIQNVVEETLRYEPPVSQLNRIATADMTVQGCPIAKGQTIVNSLLAANHDPAAHLQPRKFDIERSNKRHQAFGGGAHFCLGAPLARLEGCIGIAMLLERFPHLALMKDRPPVRRTIPYFNGIEELWVTTGR